MSIESSNSTQSEPLVLPEIEGYLARKTFPEIELPKIFNTHDPLVIFDIGACEGEDSIRYARLFPNSRVYTFEPLPENQALVLANFKKFGVKNAELHRVALTDREGTSTFHVSSGKPPEKWEGEQWNYGNKSSSLLKPELVNQRVEWLQFGRAINVQCNRIDGFLAKNHLQHIDFIHMDVQGAELLVLKGAGPKLAEIASVWLEVSDEELYKNQVLKTELERFLLENGFVKTHDEQCGFQSDQFWVNKKQSVTQNYLDSLKENKNTQPAKVMDYLRKIKRRILASQRAPDTTQVSEEIAHARKMAEFYRTEISSQPCLAFDIGANIGNRTKVFRDICWSVVAVDPQKNCCAALAKNFAGDANVKIVNKAIGEQPGMAQMYISSADVLSSLSKEFIEKTSSSGRFQESWWDRQEEVEMVALEQLISEHGVPKFIKIDVEGFELPVVKGLRQPIEFLSLEYTPELSDSLKLCIQHMDSLGDYEFNLSWCESMVMSREDWFGADKLFAIMDAMEGEKYLFGDIYLRLKKHPKA
jgi:FkbM family methyltransferase